MKASKLGLLLLILAFGAVVETAYGVRGHLSIGPEGCRVLTGRFHGPSFSFESEQLRSELPPAVALDVENAFGSVRVTAGEPGSARLRVRKVIYLASETEARDFADKVHVDAELEGTTLRVRTNRRELERDVDTSRVGVEIHLELLVPPATEVRVRNEHGRVEVSAVAQARVTNSYDPVRVEAIAGPVEVDSRHGDVVISRTQGDAKVTARHADVDLEDVTGAVSVDMEYGDLRTARLGSLVVKSSHGDVSAEDLRGDLDVEAAHCQVTADRVGGGARVVTSYRDVRLGPVEGSVRVENRHGEILLEDVAGAASVRSSGGEVVAKRIGGRLDATLERGALRAEALRGGAMVEASGDDVTLDGFAGAVEVRSRRGDLVLRPSQPLSAPVTASTASGQIQFDVPAVGPFTLDARATRGQVDVDLPDFVVAESGPHRVEGGRGAGGVAISLRTERGAVHVSGAATPERAP